MDEPRQSAADGTAFEGTTVDVTALLQAHAAGSPDALGRLLPRV